MKKFKHIALLILICLIFTACSSETKNPGNDRSAEKDREQFTSDISEENITPEPSYYDILGENDFNGDTFTILDANLDPDNHKNIALELEGEPINDALFNRDRLIEDKYNVNIKYVQMTGANAGCKALEKSVAAGLHEYDLVISSIFGGSFATIAPNKVLYNMIEAPYLSLQSPWWSKMIYENMQFSNKLYYNGGDIYLPTFSQGPAVMMFNKKLFQNNGIEDNLYNMVFEGKWTLDVLERLIKDRDRDLNSDGKIQAADDFYGIVYPNNPEYISAFLAGTGVKFSTVNANGELIMDLNTPLTITKLDKLSSMLNKINLRDQNEPILSTFRESRALFLAICMLIPQKWLRDMEDDYGILPMPKWDEAQESYVSLNNGWGGGYVGIPANADIKKSAFITEAMAYAGYEMLRKPVYEITFGAKGARDEESARIVDIIIESAYIDLGSMYDFGGTQNLILDVILNNVDFVSKYEAKEPSINKAIDKFVETMLSE